MQKQSKKVIKEWIEIALCNMLDEIMYLTKNKENRDKTMEIIKKYSAEIYNSQGYDKRV